MPSSVSSCIEQTVLTANKAPPPPTTTHYKASGLGKPHLGHSQWSLTSLAPALSSHLNKQQNSSCPTNQTELRQHWEITGPR